MNKILFLYTDLSEKSYFKLFENALKAIFKKFRKSASVEFFRLDLSLGCFDKTKALLKDKLSDCDGILFCGSWEDDFSENLFFRECFDIHSKLCFSSGKCVISPLSVSSVVTSDGTLKEEYFTDFSFLEKTVQTAVTTAKARKNELLLCTDSKSAVDRAIYKEFENSMSIARTCEVEHIEFDELICTFAKEIPSFDVLLCPENKADIITLHTLALNKFPVSQSILCADTIRVYKKETLTSGRFSNLSYASMLISLSALIEAELGLNSMGMHLRKAVLRTVEKCCYEDRHSFQKHLLFEIYSPIRKRKVKTNGSNN